MHQFTNFRHIRLGDAIFVVEAENGNVNTFQGEVTYLSHGDIELNNAFSFEWVDTHDQVVLLLEGAPRKTGRHRK
jgi:hypothetical protein